MYSELTACELGKQQQIYRSWSCAGVKDPLITKQNSHKESTKTPWRLHPHHYKLGKYLQPFICSLAQNKTQEERKKKREHHNVRKHRLKMREKEIRKLHRKEWKLE